MTLPIIQDVGQLEQCCRDLTHQQWIGVDTEFLRVRTYYPRLCLLQISCPDRVIAVDPLQCKTLDPLIELLTDTQRVKVIHAARQDLEVLYHICGSVPQPVFDTQIAAALLGYGDQISYAALVAELIGPSIAKQQTRTNWCARPLTADQLTYAYEDVYYLGTLYQRFSSELNRRNRAEWLREEGQRLVDPSLYSQVPQQAYQRMRKGHSLEPESQQVLKRLAVWRERVAQARNLPRNWVVDDRQLIALAVSRPRQEEDFTKIDDLSSKFVHRYGDDIMAIVGKVRQAGCTGIVWKTPARLTQVQKHLVSQLLDVVRGTANQHRVSAALLATRAEVERFVRGDRELLFMQGWRYRLIGDRLTQVLAQARSSR